MLFDNHTNFHYQFPEPQYLGAKFGLLNWIYKFIPKDTKVALDAFAGSQSVAFLFKQMGFETFTNDFLNFNNQIGLALIENKDQTLEKTDLEILFSANTNSQNLITKTFTGVFFEENESQFLDNFRANISLLENKYKQALALALINRRLTRKITMGHFAHTQALNYAKNPQRIARNPNLARSIKSIFLDLVEKYNQAVFDNNQQNQSFNENILDLLPRLENVDLVYFDPPYVPISKTSNFTLYNLNPFNEVDQLRLKKTVDQLTTRGVKMLLSNSFTAFTWDLYSEYNRRSLLATRNINSDGNNRGVIKEILVTN
jgi:site-specific DNA-adenine methylase